MHRQSTKMFSYMHRSVPPPCVAEHVGPQASDAVTQTDHIMCDVYISAAMYVSIHA